MADTGPGGAEPLTFAQRRIRRSPLLFTVPLVMLGLLVLVLLWEAVRANIAPDTRAQWPWRLQVLDPEALGSLLAVAVGAVLARAQYARTVRPHLGWRAAWDKGHLRGGVTAWRVGILNGGQHIAAVESCDCRLVLAGAGPADSGWIDVPAAVRELTGAGLVVAEDFQMPELGPGFPLVATGSYETVLVGAFSQRFVDRVEAFYLRVRVTDIAGDSHERTGDLLKGAKGTAHGPVG